MSDQKPGNKPALMEQLGVDYWANMPLEVIEHKMATGTETDQVYFAIIRCSWCFPAQSRYAIRPRTRSGGFAQWVELLRERIAKRRSAARDIREEIADTDEAGEPVPLRQDDICLMLGVTKNNVSRAISQLRERSLLREGSPLYPEPKPKINPSGLPPENADVLSTENWNIANLVISTENLPPDPESRERAVQWLSKLSTAWKTDLKELRTRYRNEVRQGCIENHILIRSSEESLVVSEVASTPPATPLTDHDKPTEKPPEDGGQAAEPLKENAKPDLAELITADVEERFGRKLGNGDPLRAQFLALPARFNIPARSVCRFIAQKFEAKQSARYTISSPGALLSILLNDLPGWSRQNRGIIASDEKWEQAERRERGEPPSAEQFDPMTFNTEMEMQKLAAKKGMS